MTRLEQLKKHGWGDLSDAEYQKERDAVRGALAELPDNDRVRRSTPIERNSWRCPMRSQPLRQRASRNSAGSWSHR